MAKDVITVDGNQVVVREDTAKAYRFVHWGVTTAAICLVLISILAAVLLLWPANHESTERPAQVETTGGK